MKIKPIITLIDTKTLIAGLFPVLLGSCYSLYTFGKINILFTVALILAIALVQASTNMFNDLMDYRRGTDTDGKAEEKVLVSGEMTAKQIAYVIGGFLTIALCSGIIIASQTSWYILLVALFGAFVAVFYSFGPLPISHTPFGEIASGLTMGIGITTTVAFIQVQSFHWQMVWMAIPTAIYIGFIMFTNNLCDRESDREAGRHTLPGILGFEFSKTIWILSSSFLVLITLLLIWVKVYPIWNLIVIILLLNYQKLYKMKVYQQEQFYKGKMMGVMGKIGAQYHILMIVGLLAAWVMK
jgi:1,4-dihydroxy-2-naphthoate octaprenyltransferase